MWLNFLVLVFLVMRLLGLVGMNVSEKHTAVFPLYLEDGSSIFPRSVGDRILNFSIINEKNKITILV